MKSMKLARVRLSSEQLVLFIVGGVLLASGVWHCLVWLADGGSLAGPVSWRKPILFGFSAGATVLSTGWLMGKLPRRLGDSLLLSSFAIVMLFEVGLITLQQWRGVASHFNRETPLNSAILTSIEALIFFATLVIADLTLRSFGRLQANADMALAIRGGMALLLFSCLLGFVLVFYGNQRVAQGLAPEVYGAAGVMKFPHGAAMHAIQLLPIVSWLLTKLDMGERDRFSTISYALSSVVAFTAFSLWQTFSGRSRFDVTYASTGLLVATGLLAAMALRPAFYRVGFRFFHER